MINYSFRVIFTVRIAFYECFTGLSTGFMDDIQVFGQRFLYRHRIQLFLLYVLASSLYADLPIALMIVHFDGHTHSFPPQYINIFSVVRRCN